MTVAGKEDPHYMVSIERMGWRAVPVTRHPEMMPVGWKGAIEKKGLRLMELPKVLIDRADRRRRRRSQRGLEEFRPRSLRDACQHRQSRRVPGEASDIQKGYRGAGPKRKRQLTKGGSLTILKR